MTDARADAGSSGEAVHFVASGETLAGNVVQPADGPGSSLVILCHGFSGARYPTLVDEIAAAGYSVLTFDFPGYGASGGDPREVLPQKEVTATRGAIDFALESGIAAEGRITLLGSSLGGSIAIEATAQDERVAGCVAACPIGNGERQILRRSGAEGLERLRGRIAELEHVGGLLDRYELVDIPAPLRGNLPSGTPMEFLPQTGRAFLELAPEEVVDRVVQGRPLMIIHARDDEVVPIGESYCLAARAYDCDLRTLPAGNHFILSTPIASKEIVSWLHDNVRIV